MESILGWKLLTQESDKSGDGNPTLPRCGFLWPRTPAAAASTACVPRSGRRRQVEAAGWRAAAELTVLSMDNLPH